MGIRDFIAKLKEKKAKYKEYAEQRNIEKKYEEKLKSANERELERFMKEEREDSIKKELEEFRKSRQKEAQYGNQILQTKNMFSPKYNKVLVLKNPSLFENKRNLFVGGKSVFMK